MLRAALLLAGAPAAGAPAQDGSASDPGAPVPGFAQQRFDAYTPLASNLELARRLTRPLENASLAARMTALHARLSDQAIDLTRERFGMFVPATKPAAGYGLIVFIPPWDNDAPPEDWISTLGRAGFVFVSAAQSGNDQSPVGRRIPLAILAAYNALQRLPIDPARVFITGFSGGARTALRRAVAYPDLFRGALLDAGSDPIGGADAALPPRDLFERFRTRSVLVYATGAMDQTHLDQEAASLGAMRRWCVANTVSQHIDGLNHDPLPASALASALRALTTVHAPAPRAERCWSSLVAEVDAALAAAEQAFASGDIAGARSKLDALDRKYGGLAAPRSLDLSQRIAAAPAH